MQLLDNALEFREMDGGQVDGVKLNDDEREYLLPHFLMLLVGKPGSGKTTLLKQLLTNPQMYYRKFDDVFMVSPSHAKMGIKVKQDNTTSTFSLDWLFKKFHDINEQQLEEVFGAKVKRSAKPGKSETGKTLSSGLLLNDTKGRFLLSDAFQQAQNAKQYTEEKKKDEPGQDVIMQRKYGDLKKLPRKEQERTHRNVLVVLDDVVASIKKAEFDPRLSQLVMNRRHVIFNGTVSIIMVTQKYTLIPARVRSNANWLILYQLNPLDFETAYRDSVTLPPWQWRELLKFVYGVDITTDKVRRDKKGGAGQIEEEYYGEEEEQQPAKKDKVSDALKGKKYENLGLWVEANMYFKNFKRIQL